jgi:uncharacterized protein YfaQ (DUF2300 family)
VSKHLSHRLLCAALCCMLANTAHADDFDAGSLLFARLAPSSQQAPAQAMFQRLSESSVQQAGDVQTPLGSLWKLFVYTYAVDRGLAMPPYQCRGGSLAKEELFCCNPGESVARDTALAKSCGPFFEPARLQLDARDWQRYWQRKLPQHEWLSDLQRLKPARQVSVSSLLRALSAIEGKPREQAESALLGVVLNGRGLSALPLLGGRYRVKTYTWNHPQREDSVVGGGAGWLNDGSAVWFGALGSSLKVMQDYAPQLAHAAEITAGDTLSRRCVDVDMFARYPIKRILALADGKILPAASEQDLRGRYRIEFVNGNSVQLQSNSEVHLHWQGNGNPLLTARLDENEYIARVIEREAGVKNKEAARALSVVARTYLLQNASRQGECLAIQDSSRTQRVSPKPASVEARDIAAFTTGIVLQGVNAQYRLDGKMQNVLSWQRAVEYDKAGLLFHDILRQEFVSAVLASENGETECTPLPHAERWLSAQTRQWRSVLQMEPGYIEPQPKVCQLAFGKPYSDLAHQRIYVRGLHSLNNRLTLAHEYLHLAFSTYPSGQDENYIEQWARRLIEGDSRI